MRLLGHQSSRRLRVRLRGANGRGLQSAWLRRGRQLSIQWKRPWLHPIRVAKHFYSVLRTRLGQATCSRNLLKLNKLSALVGVRYSPCYVYGLAISSLPSLPYLGPSYVMGLSSFSPCHFLVSVKLITRVIRGLILCNLSSFPLLLLYPHFPPPPPPCLYSVKTVSPRCSPLINLC